MRYSATSVAVGMGGHADSCEADSMEDVLSAWLRLSITAAADFHNYPLSSTCASTSFARQTIFHETRPGRWFVNNQCLDGPAEHSREDWEEAIALALADHAAERARRPPPVYDPPSKRRRKWWLDDYAGKHGPGTG